MSRTKEGKAQNAGPLPWLSVIVGLGFAALYAWNAAPGIVAFFDDSLEFQLVLPTFGIAHPTGYPLYTILGGLWSRLLPLGEWAGRVNLFSALCAGATVGLLCQLAQILVARSALRTAASPAWAGLFAALAFGLGPTWWANATVAEVYALHNLLAALILLLALWAGNAPARHRARALGWLFLGVGFGLAHHRTTLLLLPAVALYLLWSIPALWRPRRVWLLWLALLVAPLLLYLWLPLRAASGVQDLNGAYVNTWSGFWNHVLARAYGAFFGQTALAVERGPADWLALAVRESGWIVLPLALLGFGVGLARTTGRREWALLLLAAAGNLLFALIYRVGDVPVFLLPLWLTLAAAAAGGAEMLRQSLAGRPALLATLSILLVLPLLPFAPLRAPLESRRGEWAVHDQAVALVSGSFPEGSRVLGIEGEVTAIRYMQQTQGRAAGLTPISADDPTRRRALLEDALVAGTPLYLTRELPGIESAYSFSGEGALVRVWPRGQAQVSPPQNPLNEPMAAGALLLAGYDAGLVAGTHQPMAEVVLYWQAQEPLTQTFKVSLRVVGTDGEPLLLAGGAPAVQDLYPLRLIAPSTTWLPGETLRDVYPLPLPAQRTGAQILVILYDSSTQVEAGRFQFPVP